MGISSPKSEPAIRAQPGSAIDPMRSKWRALHAKSCRIAQMADLAPEDMENAASRFDSAFADPIAPTLTIARHGIEDIEQLVERGLTALNEVQARGQDTNAPALALWREFYHARESVLAIAEPTAA